MLSKQTLLCKKVVVQVLQTNILGQGALQRTYFQETGMQGSPLRRPLSKNILTALAQQAKLPATWANSFANCKKISIAAAILVQVLGEEGAVLSRVFKHCGHAQHQA